MHPDPSTRIAGILAPVFSIRGERDLGIGDTVAAAEFAAWAASRGFRALQVLPVNETGSDHSPYNAISAMAIDPLTVATDPDALPDLGRDAFDAICARHEAGALRAGPVQYRKVAALKRELLREAFRSFGGSRRKGAGTRRREFAEFVEAHSDWLETYAFFRALMEFNGGSEVTDTWPEEHRSPAGALAWLEGLPPDEADAFRESMQFFRFVQWVAWSQWVALHQTCNDLGVALIGDIPVGVSLYSCDVWERPDLFDVKRSSGAPPERVFAADAFTAQWGQNWGFPLYDWQAMSHDNFAWWRRRLRGILAMFDLVRVDHALGFFRIYSFPWRPQENDSFVGLSEDEARARTGGELPHFVPNDDSNDENRERNRRHGETLLRILLEETGPHRLIAEDLGAVAPYVRPTLAALEIPGFKIPQWESEPDGELTPGSRYPRLSLATYATHDHPSFPAMWTELYGRAMDPDPGVAGGARHEMARLLRFAGVADASDSGELPPFSAEVQRRFLAALFGSESWLAVPMITDLLSLTDRFNVPGAVGDQNWTLRVPGTPTEIERDFAEELETVAAALAGSGRA